jgi:hypothetical protein
MVFSLAIARHYEMGMLFVGNAIIAITLPSHTQRHTHTFSLSLSLSLSLCWPLHTEKRPDIYVRLCIYRAEMYVGTIEPSGVKRFSLRVGVNLL